MVLHLLINKHNPPVLSKQWATIRTNFDSLVVAEGHQLLSFIFSSHVGFRRTFLPHISCHGKAKHGSPDI
jgi:hypothetical protein